MYDDPSLIPPPNLPIEPLPTDPHALAELARDAEVTKGLATDEEVRWLVEQVVPEEARTPECWEAMRFQAGTAVHVREAGMPPHWAGNSARRVLKTDEATDPGMVAFWEKLWRAMQRLASPDWRPDR